MVVLSPSHVPMMSGRGSRRLQHPECRKKRQLKINGWTYILNKSDFAFDKYMTKINKQVEEIKVQPTNSTNLTDVRKSV